MSGVREAGMKCTEVREVFLSGKPVTGEQASAAHREHVAVCPVCRQLYSEDAPTPEAELSAEPPLMDLDVLRSAVLADQAAEEATLWSKLRSVSQRVRWVVAIGGVLFAVVVGVLRHRVDIDVYPGGRMAAALVSQLALTLFMCAVLLRPLYKPLWPRRLMPFGVLALLLPLTLSVLPAAQSPNPESWLGVNEDFLARVLSCAAWGTVVAAPFVALLLLIDRHGGRWRSLHLSTAVTGGVVANLALQLHCPLVSPVHLVPGHATVGLILLGIVAVGIKFRRSRQSNASR